MQDYLDYPQIKSLLDSAGFPALSIYMPTHRGGSESKQNLIRLKNAIMHAKQQLAARGWSDRESDAFLAPCRTLLDDGSFWRSLSDGLVIFRDRSRMEYYRLPFSFDDLVVTADMFFIKPLIPFLNRSGDFYLLALSEQNVRLFRGNGYGMHEVEIPGVPRSLKEAFPYDEPEQQQQWHTRTSQASLVKAGMRQAVFHSQGGAAETAKTDRDRFLRLIDRRLNRVLTDKSIPMILASVDYSLASYESVNTYPRLLDEHVQGNPDHLDEHDLWRRAWPIIEPQFLKQRADALKRCQEQVHSDRGGRSFEKVTPRAYEGRVDELIVAIDRNQYGKFDPNTMQVTLYDAPEPDSIELLEFTAHHTLRNGGTVYGMHAREVPGHAWLLATFRY
ncbi:MAG TPA: hypothetical protein PLT93_10365 [Phycisphaerae bacterium]|nr:hypothetical protein [Phycisphaerae bacterium]